jgi:hypothetical protein
VKWFKARRAFYLSERYWEFSLITRLLLYVILTWALLLLGFIFCNPLGMFKALILSYGIDAFNNPWSTFDMYEHLINIYVQDINVFMLVQAQCALMVEKYLIIDDLKDVITADVYLEILNKYVLLLPYTSVTQLAQLYVGVVLALPFVIISVIFPIVFFWRVYQPLMFFKNFYNICLEFAAPGSITQAEMVEVCHMVRDQLKANQKSFMLYSSVTSPNSANFKINSADSFTEVLGDQAVLLLYFFIFSWILVYCYYSLTWLPFVPRYLYFFTLMLVISLIIKKFIAAGLILNFFITGFLMSFVVLKRQLTQIKVYSKRFWVRMLFVIFDSAIAMFLAFVLYHLLRFLQ